jgi:hypothetical protein
MQPSINQICSSPQGLIAIAGNKILVSRLEAHSKAVPRFIPLPGIPSRLAYDENLNTFVVTVEINNRPRLALLNPDTGELLLFWSHHLSSFVSPSLIDSQAIVLHLSTIHNSADSESIIVIVAGKERDSRKGFLHLCNIKREDFSEPGISTAHSTISYTKWSGMTFDRPVYSATATKKEIFFCMGNQVIL